MNNWHARRVVSIVDRLAVDYLWWQLPIGSWNRMTCKALHLDAYRMRAENGGDGIRERVEALRQEIGEIQKLNLAYLQTPRPDFTAMEAHTRREQRLKDIMNELKSMTTWKKT
jgi:hypothetical protein